MAGLHSRVQVIRSDSRSDVVQVKGQDSVLSGYNQQDVVMMLSPPENHQRTTREPPENHQPLRHQNNHRATTALIIKEYSHNLYQIKQQKLQHVYNMCLYDPNSAQINNSTSNFVNQPKPGKLAWVQLIAVTSL